MLARPFARANRIRDGMIVASFGCYVPETGHDHERPSGRMEAPSPDGLVKRAVGLV